MLGERPFGVAASIVLAAGAAGCDHHSAEIGANYNDCLLKNLRTSADQVASELVVQTCRRAFDIAASYQLEPSVQLASNQRGGVIEGPVMNPTSDQIVTMAQVTARFYRAKDMKEQLGFYTWTVSQDIEPNQAQLVTLSLGERPPSDVFSVDARAMRAIRVR